jgi:hypothetical protein
MADQKKPDQHSSKMSRRADEETDREPAPPRRAHASFMHHSTTSSTIARTTL